MKRFGNWMVALLCATALAACGGGGSGPSSTTSATGGGGSDTSTSTTTAAYSLSLQVQRAGVATTQVSSSETVEAVATVTAKDGSPVPGVVVTFAETGVSLLKFAPAAATALTDSTGVASIDVSAADATKTGATTVSASATVSTVAIAGAVPIAITASGTVAVATPAAVNFISSVPADKAIVIKGSGGNGRSESAILTFEVVDSSNAPIKGVQVDFAINASSGGAALQNATGVSNASGLVTATVSSGANPASIVVTAVVDTAPSVTSQSDSLLVSNGVPIAGGFEIDAAKYNLDGRKTGDSTTITAFVRDSNGNPVADGVAVSFVTDYGVVGASTLGGCVTANGQCTVTFAVQDPRGDGVATVIATVRVGSTNVLTAGIQINMAGATGTSYAVLNADSTVLSQLTLNTCKVTQAFLLSDGNGHSTSVGTVVTASLASTGVAVTVASGSPSLDQLASNFPPTPLGLTVDLTGGGLAQPCVPGGTLTPSPDAFFDLQMKSSGGIVFTQRVGLTYPQ